MPLKYKLIIDILSEYGFKKVRLKGSHTRYEKNGFGLTVGFHSEYPPKTAKSMLNDIAKISEMDYSDLIDKFNIKI